MKLPKATLAALPVVLAAVILTVMAVIAKKDGGSFFARKADAPPTIEFTWTPAGAVSLMEMKAKLRLVDDHALDFKTYKMTLVELDRELRLPLAEELIGKEYEDSLSFSLVADDPKLYGSEKLTVQIEVSDDEGQKTSIEKIIKLKPPLFDIKMEAR